MPTTTAITASQAMARAVSERSNTWVPVTRSACFAFFVRAVGPNLILAADVAGEEHRHTRR